MKPKKTINHFFSIITILLFITQLSNIYARAGRGSSYRSGSSSSSYSGSSSSSSSNSFSGRSSSSSYSGSSPSNSYSDSTSNSSYEPVRTHTATMNLTEYNAWITLKEDGKIHVYEEFHWKGDPFSEYTGFIREFPFRSHPWNIPLKSIQAKGDVSSITYSSAKTPGMKITFSPTKRKNALYILEYIIKDGIYQGKDFDTFQFPFHLNGSAENVYFEVTVPKLVDLKKVTSEFGNYFSQIPHKNNRRNLWIEKITPGYTSDNKRVYFKAKNASFIGFKVKVTVPKHKFPVYKEDYQNYAMNHKKAEYYINILPNGIIESKGIFNVETKTTQNFIPRLLLPENYLPVKIDEKKSVSENLSDPMSYQSLENLSYDETEYGIWYTFKEKLKKENKYIYKIRCYNCIDQSDSFASAQIILPTAVSENDLKGYDFSTENNSSVEKTIVHINMPDGITLKKDKIKIYLGSYEDLGSDFYYIDEIKAPVTIDGSKIEFTLERPLHLAQRYMVELNFPDTAITESDFWPYTKAYLTWQTNEKPWSFYIYLILALIGLFIAYKIFDSLYESKAEKTERIAKRAAMQEKLDKKLREQALKSNRTFVKQRILPNDPSFNLSHFIERVIHTSEIIQDAWSHANMNRARNFISSGLYNRFRIQLKMMNEQERLKNLVYDCNVVKVQLNHEEIIGDYYAIHVVITDRARDITVGINAGKEEIEDALNSTQPSDFKQVYSFLRKKDAQSSDEKNFLKNQCPSCGATIENSSDKSKCPYCGNIFNSGEHDWVLAEITQWSEWRLDRRKEPLSDPSIHPQVLEDRVSYLFWQYLYSQSTAEKETLKRHTTSSFYKDTDIHKIYYTEPVIGSVDFIKSSKAGENISAADIEIKWSAGTDNREPINRTSKIRLVRDDANYENPGFGGAACTSCGAPLPDDYKNNCEFCGADLPKKSRDWLIHKIE